MLRKFAFSICVVINSLFGEFQGIQTPGVSSLRDAW